MAHQQAISKKRLKRKVGSRQQVIIDEVGPTVAKGRSKGDAPEIDGAVYVKSKRPLQVGEFATVKIERADEYDLHGTAVLSFCVAQLQAHPSSIPTLTIAPVSLRRVRPARW